MFWKKPRTQSRSPARLSAATFLLATASLTKSHCRKKKLDPYCSMDRHTNSFRCGYKTPVLFRLLLSC